MLIVLLFLFLLERKISLRINEVSDNTVSLEVYHLAGSDDRDIIARAGVAHCKDFVPSGWDIVRKGEIFSRSENRLTRTPDVLLVDESMIPASFGGKTLFVRGKPILDSDENYSVAIEEIAENLAISIAG